MAAIPNHEFYFSTNRFLWLSLIPESEREELFPGATSQIPKNLVTTYVFCGVFWTDPIVNLSASERNLTAERAWFGIRTFVKGSHIAESVARDGLTEGNFAQLGHHEDKDQVYRGQTVDYFQDKELITLVSIYNKYSNWLSNKEKYDEMDIVRRALIVSRSKSDLWNKGEGVLNSLDEKQKLQVVSVLNMSNEDVFHKKDAIKAIESKKFTSKVRDKYVKFLKSWIGDGERRADGVHSHNGIKIYKKRLSSKDRLLFSWVTCSDYNEGKPFLLIYNIVFDHDSVNSYLAEKIDARIEDFSLVENANIEPQDIESFAQTIGNGPTKPLPGRINLKSLDNLDLPHNIALDENQRRAIVENQPLLIDGLAGTGKTAVLSRRAAFRAGFAGSNTKILLLSSNNGVVKRLLQDVSNLAKNEQYWKKNNREFSQNLYTVSFQDKKIPNSTELAIDDLALFHKFDFDEVLLDECQDVTPLEFEVLKIFVKYNDVRRFSFGGDPLQTLNPTGFDWGRIKSLFVNSIGENKSENQLSTIAKGIIISKFHQNYRSQGDIVELANAIQRHRSKAVSSDDLIEMIPHHPGSQKPRLVEINPKNEDDVSAVVKALLESGLGRVTAICWATDDHEVIKICTGEGSDGILEEVWSTKQKEDPFQNTDFRTALELHSSASIKGGEKHAVLLYKFGTSHGSKLDTLLSSFEDLNPVKQVDKIPVSYAYSRLYVAITRAFKNVYFVEENAGIEFWKSVNFHRSNGESLFQSKIERASALSNMPDFILEDDLTRELFDDHLLNWKNNGDKNSLFSAIRILRHLISKNKADEADELTLLELEGDKALHFDDDEDLAIKKYRGARKPQKYMPLMFRKRMWNELKERLASSGDAFDQALFLYCDIQLSNNIVEAVDLEDFVKIIENQQPQLVSHWRNELHSMKKFVDSLKDNFLNKYPKSTSLVKVLLDGYSQFFGWELLLKFMKKVADDNPRIYIDFIFTNRPKKYNLMEDRKYTSSLEKVRDELSGDDKITFIKKHQQYVLENKQSEWDRVHAAELDKKISTLPKKGFQRTIQDNPSYVVKTKPANDTSRLFSWLDEIQNLIPLSFAETYSRRIESIIKARNEEDPIRRFEFLEDALDQDERAGKVLNKDKTGYTQINWIDWATIATWVNKTRRNPKLKKLDNYGDVKSFFECCLNIAEDYSNRGEYKKLPIFKEPTMSLKHLSISSDENNDIIQNNYRFKLVDEIGQRLVSAIQAKRGGSSIQDLIDLIDRTLIDNSLSSDFDDALINQSLKRIRPKMSKEGKAHFDLLHFRISKRGVKLEKEFRIAGEPPITNPNLDKFVKLLRKAGHEDLANNYESRKITDEITIQKEVRSAPNVQEIISALNRGNRGIGNYSFLTIDIFRTIMEKLSDKSGQLFEIPNKDEVLSKFWNEFLQLNPGNEIELIRQLITGIEPIIYVHGFSFVKKEIMLLGMMKDSLREPTSILNDTFTSAVTNYKQLVLSNTSSVTTSGKGKGVAKQTPAKAKKQQVWSGVVKYFEGLKFTDETKLNDEVVAFLLIQNISKREYKLPKVKELCELVGAKKTGKKADLIIGLCEAVGMTDSESYGRLIDVFSVNSF